MKAVAIDGPAGAGKSSIAKQAALELGFIYVDTGALYRVIALNALTNNIDTQNEQAICDSLDLVKVELKFINGSQCVFLNGVDVSSEIRKPQVSMCASQVSAIPRVREFLFGLQQDIAAKNNVIMDGRDIGTVVLPNADVKIFLTASAEVRAKRRYREHIERGESVDFDTLLEDIKKRDYNDSTRAISPLKQADDAVLADTSDLNLEESIELVKSIILKKIAK